MRRIRKRGRHLQDLSPPARHKIRIEAKKLRYASEFFASLANTKKKRRRQEAFSTALTALQDHLGELNDIATSDKFTKGVPQELSDRASDRDSSEGIDTALGGSKNINRSLKAAISAFRDMETAKPFWDAPRSKRGEP